jgi:hypothetical protein
MLVAADTSDGRMTALTQPMQRDSSSIAALAGFVLATASALIAIWLRSYGFAIGGFAHGDPLLTASFRTGMALSGVGVLLALSGLRPPTRLRWLGVGWALLGLASWLLAALTR